MHCNGAVHAFSDSSVWRQSLLVDVLAYWAVPVFVMLSGATLMNYRRRYSTKVFLRRRFLKTGVPLVIWTVFFYVFYRTRGTIAWTGWRAFLNSVINFSIVPVYWFFPPLFMVYLSLPVLSLLVQNRKILWYITVLAFASCSVFPFVCTALGLTYWGSFAFPMMGGYLLFAVLGYLLPWEYTNWPTILLAAAIFVFIKYACDYPIFRNEKFIRLIKWLSGASFGIYLIHVLVIDRITSWFSVDTLSGWWRLFGAFAVYFVALLLVKVLQKIPYVGKYLFP